MPIKRVRPKIGDYVHIVFWDHCECFHNAMQFTVVGKLDSITKEAYRVKCWYYHDQVQRAADDSADKNEHDFCIVKKAIESIRILK